MNPEFSFAIIKHFNSVNSATTLDGKNVKREEMLLFDEPGKERFIRTAPYDNHFIYIDPLWRSIKGRWKFMCTCGSPAGIVGYNAYKNDASSTETGELLVCLSHARTGKHGGGST